MIYSPPSRLCYDTLFKITSQDNTLVKKSLNFNLLLKLRLIILINRCWLLNPLHELQVLFEKIIYWYVCILKCTYVEILITLSISLMNVLVWNEFNFLFYSLMIQFLLSHYERKTWSGKSWLWIHMSISIKVTSSLRSLRRNFKINIMISLVKNFDPTA